MLCYTGHDRLLRIQQLLLLLVGRRVDRLPQIRRCFILRGVLRILGQAIRRVLVKV